MAGNCFVFPVQKWSRKSFSFLLAMFFNAEVVRGSVEMEREDWAELPQVHKFSADASLIYFFLKPYMLLWNWICKCIYFGTSVISFGLLKLWFIQDWSDEICRLQWLKNIYIDFWLCYTLISRENWHAMLYIFWASTVLLIDGSLMILPAYCTH